MIRVENVTKMYGPFQALKGISFSIEKGEIVGFLGPNGAGKTTAMRILTGYFPSNDGKVFINDFDIEENPKEAKSVLGYLPENPPLYPEMPVNEYLVFVAKLKGMTKEKISERLEYVINKTNLQDKRFSQIKNLSKGLKQRVGIAAAIIHDPQVVILDEPTIGLDPIQIIEIRDLIKEIGKEKTIILSSHILAEIQEVCDKVLVINKGEIIAQDTKENLRKKLSTGLKFRIRIKEAVADLGALLTGISGIKTVTALEDGYFEIITEEIPNIQAEITKTIVSNNLSLLEVKEADMTLEEIFAKLIKENA